ncbi:lipase family protein [Nocardia sp. NPDC050712]|uniref:lipase family protein n=1 Tax=Nocardia sp. NPDC050712 TaxID=3155518 RepID=UPI00340F67CA
MRPFRATRLAAAVTAVGILVSMSAQLTAAADTSDLRIEPVPGLTLPPELDEFYAPPAGIVAAAAPGQVLRVRAIAPAFFGIAHLNVDAWQLLYRTTNSFGEAIATVTTVLKPRGARPDGGRKLLSYQIAEDSAAQYCAPSYVIQAGAIPADYVNAAEVLIPIAAGIGQGWTVSLPDYEGPNSAYAASRIGAQATLDGIRAVQSFEPAQLSGVDTPTALWGYSGGTVPSSFAAEIAQDYAPELDIVGIAAGGVAAADWAGVVRHNNRGLYTGLVLGAFVGLANEYPELRQALRENMDPLGQLLLGSKLVLCHPMGTGVVPFYDYFSSFRGGDPLAHPAVQRVIADNSLGQRTPSVPVYIYHAQNDEILPAAPVDRLVDEYCAEGAPSVTYVREFLAEHISGVLTHLPAAFHWLRDRLNGIPAQPGCTITSPTTAATDPEFTQGLNELLPTAVQAIVGQAIGANR